MELSEEKIVELYRTMEQKRPIVHCITNAVTVNDCANILLAVGASPTMAHHPMETAEITQGATSLVCNFGAIADYEAMLFAGKKHRNWTMQSWWILWGCLVLPTGGKNA